jgi:hypothetical protein
VKEEMWGDANSARDPRDVVYTNIPGATFDLA